jgi:hypothetical protein
VSSAPPAYCHCRSPAALATPDVLLGAVRTRRGPSDTNPALALRVYRQAMRRDDDEKVQLRALVEGSAWQEAVFDSLSDGIVV